MTRPAESSEKPGSSGKTLLQQRGHHEQCEVAEDDGRDAAEQFEDRLGDFAHLAVGELGQVDGDDGAHRDGDASATAEETSVPEMSTMMPKWASSNSGVHWVSVRKSTMLTLGKKTIDSETST
jgi:hypothetical protein